MKHFNELKWNELKYFFAAESEKKPASNVAPVLIGQQRAAEAIEHGLRLKTKGYNIYICGQSGTGRTTFAESFAKKQAESEPVPPDLCYVYNFENPKCPMLLKLPAGGGAALRDRLGETMDQLTGELPRSYSNRDFESKKNDIIKIFQNKRDEIIKVITEEARLQCFGVKNTNHGIYFMPIIDGKMIDEEQFDALPQDQKDSISENSESIQKRAAEVMRDIKDYEKATRKDVEDLEYTIGLMTVGRNMDVLLEYYADQENILSYLMAVKEDILSNLNDFTEDDSDDDDPMQNMLPWYNKKNTDDLFTKYKINLLTDNSELTGAPVVLDYNPSYTNLIGEIEYDNEFGNFSTDFMKIKPGLLHKANGGYLILYAQDLLSNLHAWDTLRKTLLTGAIVTEPMREYNTGITVSGIKPEPIDINVKIILIGSGWYYDMLYGYDDHFEKLFRVRADFDYEMKLNEANISELSAFVEFYARKSNLPAFDSGAVGQLIEQAARYAERQDRLTTKFALLTDIMTEAAADAGETITAAQIKKAVARREKRLNMYEEKLSEMIEEDYVLIDTAGGKVGQINGLAVIDTGDYAFAKPSRITATTYMGKAGIINIEKEAEMSGSIHDKGVQVLSGYLGQTYAQDFPLSLSCRICFEQNYHGIDGDSASSTELYAVLSSLAQLPIRQDIAVTGSINQRGEIQPIGGTTFKIEGFFYLCKKRGLTGRQGVVIPKQNVRDLVLKDEVVDAVKEGMFHIYPISHIDDGIEILTGLEAGKPNDKGRYPDESVHGKVMKRLKTLFKKAMKCDE